MAVTIITPEEVRKSMKDYIPEIIFETINSLIIENFDGTKSKVYQDDILKRVCNTETGLTSDAIFSHHYLDIEYYYREKGWKVEYDKPAYCESYKAYFIFKAIN